MNRGQHYNLPSKPNPFVQVRQDLGLTADQVADDLQMHRNSIIRTEQGQYELPPQDLLDYYFVSQNRQAEIIQEYKSWKIFIRKENFGLLKPGLIWPEFVPKVAHPFKQWRLVSGVKALNTIAKAFALHQGILFRYESQPERCNTTPEIIMQALMQSGYDPRLLYALEVDFQVYKRLIRDSLTITHSNAPVGKAS